VFFIPEVFVRGVRKRMVVAEMKQVGTSDHVMLCCLVQKLATTATPTTTTTTIIAIRREISIRTTVKTATQGSY